MRVRLKHLLAWCGPCLPISALGLPLVVYLPPHYAGTLGLPLATVGFIFAFVRIIDIPIDPLLGAWMDGTRSRIGQFRPWILGGGFVLAAGVWLLFMARPGVTATMAFLSLLLLYIGWSMVYLAQTAWGSRLSPDYTERTRIFGFWTAANAFATLLVLLIPPAIAFFGLAGGPSSSVHAMGWFVLALIPLTVAAAITLVPEGEAAGPQHRIRFADVRRVMADRRMQLLLLGDLLLSVVPGITGALFLFFFTAARAIPAGTASALLLGYFLAGLLAAPLWVKGASRFGKHRMAALAGFWLGAAQLGVWAIPEGAIALTALAFLLAGAPISAPPFLLRAMLADLTDAQELDRRRSGDMAADTTGLNYALLTATQKLGYAIPVGLTYPILGLIGFDPTPGASNGPSAIAGLTALYVGPPFLLGALAAWLIWRWPITAEVHARIRAELQETQP
ncbi:MFS transporter [Sandaracinobacter sp. RS1-74]|uniref:MFS transporter n=1 Tax=Sandaracinobacteroides sayramensis TaxID=2913411 RepID=UPI001EDC4844|nr:MFS transporter [Sandaracinobacteroides sayramensis]MCG2839789.1 MFS transporter [Sandaracinobacteroides sayramensis]